MNRRLFLSLGVCAVCVACGSGGADPSTSTSPTDVSSSSGASKSGSSSRTPPSTSSGSSSGVNDGFANCGATCLDFADITFDESNTDGALDSALVDACRAGKCVHGRVTTDATGARLIDFEPDESGAKGVLGRITQLEAGPFRFGMRWTLPWDINQIKDGEIYTVTARAETGGATLFSRSFTAAYQTMSICGGTCKQWSEGP